MPHALAEKVGPLLVRLCQLGDRLGENKQIDTVKVSMVTSLCEALHKKSRCSDAVFINQVVYLSRLDQCPGFTICSYNIFQVLLGTFVLACKSTDDLFYANSFYSEIARVELSSLNKLEEAILKLLSWKLFVSDQEYRQVEAVLRVQVEQMEHSPAEVPSKTVPTVRSSAK